MNAATLANAAAGAPASDAQLHAVVQRLLARAGAGEVASVRRRPSPYRSSFPLEELDVVLRAGGELRVAFKRLAWEGLAGAARLAKPRFLFDPRREPAVYGSLLASAPAGPPRCLGAVGRRGGERWLFLEWVEGRELYQVGERDVWGEVARWLGRLHASLRDLASDAAGSAHLLEHDAAHHRRWIERALHFSSASGRQGRARGVRWLAARYDAAIEALVALPRTIIHGDFNAANVLVGKTDAGIRVAPVDWELAAVAPGLMDLAALVSGAWSEQERDRLVRAYAAADGVPAFSARDLRLARLALAVQWLGWAPPAWVAPATQRHDWLGDALALAEELGL